MPKELNAMKTKKVMITEIMNQWEPYRYAVRYSARFWTQDKDKMYKFLTKCTRKQLGEIHERLRAVLKDELSKRIADYKSRGGN